MAEDLQPILERLEQKIDKIDATHGTAIEQLQGSVDLLAKHLAPIPGAIARLDKRVGDVHSELKAFRAETDAKFVEGSDRLDTVEKTVRRHDRQIAVFQRKIGN
ncbi:MAG: hypothetical protein WBQ14_02185 [Gaiellaceae bacterium]